MRSKDLNNGRYVHEVYETILSSPTIVAYNCIGSFASSRKLATDSVKKIMKEKEWSKVLHAREEVLDMFN